MLDLSFPPPSTPNISPCHRLEPQRTWKDYGTPDICHVAQWHRSSHNLMDVIGCWEENMMMTMLMMMMMMKTQFLILRTKPCKEETTHQVNTHKHTKKTCRQTEMGRMPPYKLNKKLIPSLITASFPEMC